MRYIAGQFATIEVEGVSRRSYSFATPPNGNGRRDITFFIRKTPGGAFTEPLFAEAFDRTDLTIEGPRGRFYLRPGEGHMICVAGGSGLAPLLSLLHDARKKDIRRRCALLFGARTKSDLYVLEEIEQIARDWLEPFTFIPVLSEEHADSDWSGERGLVTEALKKVLSGLSQDELAQAQGYMCGPPPMIDHAITILLAAGIGLSRIYYDKFTDARPAEQSA